MKSASPRVPERLSQIAYVLPQLNVYGMNMPRFGGFAKVWEAANCVGREANWLGTIALHPQDGLLHPLPFLVQ